jgi:hypothetical protein
MARNDRSTIRRFARTVAVASIITVVGVASPVLADPVPPAPAETVVEPPVPSSVPAGALDGQFVSGSNRTGAIVSFAALAGLLGLAVARRRSTADSTDSVA